MVRTSQLSLEPEAFIHLGQICHSRWIGIRQRNLFLEATLLGKGLIESPKGPTRLGREFFALGELGRAQLCTITPLALQALLDLTEDGFAAEDFRTSQSLEARGMIMRRDEVWYPTAWGWRVAAMTAAAGTRARKFPPEVAIIQVIAHGATLFPADLFELETARDQDLVTLADGRWHLRPLGEDLAERSGVDMKHQKGSCMEGAS